MSSGTPCVPCCGSTVQTTDIPGSQGASAITTVTSSFVVPSIGSTVSVNVGDTSWMYASSSIGNNLWILGGNFMITAVNSSTNVTLMYIGLPDDPLSVGDTVAAGSVVSSGLGGYRVPPALSGLSNFTDNSGGSASSTIAAGVGIFTLPVFVQLAQITATTIFTLTPGFRFKVLSINFSVEVAVTTASKAATITPAIGGVSVTGGALALTSANCTPKGANVSGSSITAANTGTNAQTLTLVASGVTAFSEGTGWVLLRLQNMDSADFAASVATKLSSLMAILGKP